MMPFDYERIERPDDSICIYHNVTILKWTNGLKKEDFFTKAKYNIDKELIQFYIFDRIVCSFYLETELEMA